MRHAFLILAFTACGEPRALDFGGQSDDTSANPTDSDRPGGTDGPDTDAGPDVPSGIDTIALSGSRLRRRVARGADGSEQFLGWWDKQLEIACGATLSADGRLRCLPSVGADRTSPVAFGTEFYTDKNCTDRVVAVTCSAADWIITSETTAGCETEQRVQTPTGPYSGDVYQRSGARCVGPTTTAQLDVYSFFRVREVPPSTFLELTVSVE